VAARARDRDAAQPRLSLTPLPVPHGDEISDTLAFEVCGPTHRLFYCPDINDWDRWEHDPRRLVAQMDVALLDGTFVGTPELPGRDTRGISPPLVADTARRLSGVDCDARLVHVNHSNPLHRPGLGRRWLLAQGIRVGVFGGRRGL